MMTLQDTRRKFPKHLSDEEFLLRAVMPQEQVDAMIARGPAARHYNPRTRGVVKLVSELAQRPGNKQVVIDKPDFRLELRSNDASAETT